MAITIITGIPGSGKSYYAMYQLMIGDVLDKYLVYHNIDGLKPENFGEKGRYLRAWDESKADEFFTKEVQHAICESAKDEFGCHPGGAPRRPVLLIVDEAQNIFDSRDPVKKAWATWHRHEGQDVWFICQHKTMIARHFRQLAEREVVGKKSSIIDHFVYAHLAGGENWRLPERLPKKKMVFAAYKSFDTASAPQKKSRLLLMVIVAFVASFVMLGYAVKRASGTFTDMAGGKQPQKEKAVVEKRVEVSKQLEGVKDKAVARRRGEFDSYSLASVLGNAVWCQAAGGGLVPLDSLIGDYQVLEAKDGCVVVMSGGELKTVCKRVGLVKVAGPEKSLEGGL